MERSNWRQKKLQNKEQASAVLLV